MEGVGALIVFSAKGYSFTDVVFSYYGVFPSLDAFKNDAHSKGYILSDEISDVEGTHRTRRRPVAKAQAYAWCKRRPKYLCLPRCDIVGT